MGNTDEDLESEVEEICHEESHVEREKIAQDIRKRANNPLVNARVRAAAERFSEDVKRDGSGVLSRVENDFYDLPSLMKLGQYKDWKKVEFRELYRVLYGKRL